MRIVARGPRLTLDFANQRPGANPALGIKRSELDDALLRFAEKNGVRVLERTRVSAPLTRGNRVAGVRARTREGEQTFEADFVVAADGLHSTFARSLGLEKSFRWPRRLGLVARFRGVSEPVTGGQMHIADGVYAGVSPVGEDEVNVSLVVPMGSKPPEASTAEFYESTLSQVPGVAAILSGAERMSSIRGVGPMARRVRRCAGPGCLLVGDAAGFFDPLTGEGIHRALRGAELAAAAVAVALQREDRMPVGYEAGRDAQFNDKERVCRLIQGMLLSTPVLRYAARRAGARPEVRDNLTGILGDYTSARAALRPAFLWNLFRP